MCPLCLSLTPNQVAVLAACFFSPASLWCPGFCTPSLLARAVLVHRLKPLPMPRVVAKVSLRPLAPSPRLAAVAAADGPPARVAAAVVRGVCYSCLFQ
jgi:hypothetical protein